MSEQAVWASMTADHAVWASTGAGDGAGRGVPGHAVRAVGPGGDGATEAEDLDEDDLDDDDLDDDDLDDDEDDDDDLDEFEDDELDDEEDDDDEADEIDFTEDRYGRAPGEDGADM